LLARVLRSWLSATSRSLGQSSDAGIAQGGTRLLRNDHLLSKDHRSRYRRDEKLQYSATSQVNIANTLS
jgi:hypothetical protein